MRVVVLLPKHNAGAELALNRLLQDGDVEVVGIVRSDNSPLKKRYWKYLFYGVRRWGVFYAAIVGLFFSLHFVGLFLAALFWWRRKIKWLSVDQLIKKHGLLVHDTEDINSAESLEEIEAWNPDILVSLYFDQILKKKALSLAKIMNLNMHPGPLPTYKGLWPCFWLLYNQSKKAGVTIHQMTEQLDSGDVLAFKQYPVEEAETKYSLMLKSSHYGAQILLEVLKKIRQGVPLKPLQLKGKSMYYSLPSRQQMKRFFRLKKRLFWIPTDVCKWETLS